jgi:hypothetical protein
MPRILVGTANGLRIFDSGGAAEQQHIEGHDVRAVAPEAWTRLWAVVDRRELWHTGEDGEWVRVASVDDAPGAAQLEALCLADTRANDVGGILVGTSQARLLRVGADHRVEVVAGFDAAPGRDEWYTPWGAPPDTRTISEDDTAVFVNVHVGGVLRSRDEGATWQPTIDVHADVHRVVTGAGRVYAAGATGLSVSEDGGDTWRLATAGLHARYCRSVAVCGPVVLLSASEGPDGRRAALYRSGLSADKFERCSDGLPGWFEGNLDSLCLDALPDGKLAAFATQNGDVYASEDQGSSWTRVVAGMGSVRCALVLP